MSTRAPSLRLALWGAALVLVGLLISGPVGVLVVAAVAPQPPWAGAELFIRHYHPIQTAPFFFAYLMVVGFPAMHAGILLAARPERRPLALLSLVLVGAFSALISFNYIAQTTIIPAAVRSGDEASHVALALFAFANPSSVCWAIEMYGYALLGLGSLLAAPAFGGSRRERVAAALLVANGVGSVAGAAATSVDMRWLLARPGLALFTGWNALVLAMVAAVILALRARDARA